VKRTRLNCTMTVCAMCAWRVIGIVICRVVCSDMITLTNDWRLTMKTELILAQIELIVAQIDAVTEGLQRLIERNDDVH